MIQATAAEMHASGLHSGRERARPIPRELYEMSAKRCKAPIRFDNEDEIKCLAYFRGFDEGINE